MCRLYGCNICGEGGEYETLVLDCPLFTHARIILDTWEIDHLSAGDVAILRPLTFHTEPKLPAGSPAGTHQADRMDASETNTSSAAASKPTVPISQTLHHDECKSAREELGSLQVSMTQQSAETSAESALGGGSRVLRSQAEVHMVPCEPAERHDSAALKHPEQSSFAADPKHEALVKPAFTAEASYHRSSQAPSACCAPEATGNFVGEAAPDLTEVAVDAALAEISQGEYTLHGQNHRPSFSRLALA